MRVYEMLRSTKEGAAAAVPSLTLKHTMSPERTFNDDLPSVVSLSGSVCSKGATGSSCKTKKSQCTHENSRRLQSILAMPFSSLVL